MNETLFWIFVVMFAISAIGFVVSLFYTKKTLAPMFGFVIAMNVFNVGIQLLG